MSKYNRFIKVPYVLEYTQGQDSIIINLDDIQIIYPDRKIKDGLCDKVVLKPTGQHFYIPKEFGLLEKLERLGDRVYEI